MDPRGLEVRDQASFAVEDKNSASNFHDEARAMMFGKPGDGKGTAGSDCCKDKTAAVAELAETPEVKAAYKQMLDKTKGVDPVAVADSINLFGDLAATNGKLPKLALPEENKDNKSAKDGIVQPDNVVEPQVSQAYQRLLQRGLNPVLIVDVLNVAGDVAAIAMSPQGRKLFEDIKTLIGHLRG